jgi:2-polyprenyl-3-methyl-5-hydroxy-6-metoxy-1,4-benzoquinol methylase
MITPSTRPDQQDTAARRWRRLVRARLAETKALSGSADVGAAFWDPRARRFARRTAGTAEGDPLLARVRGVAGSDTDVLDVGCGPGRFALALAPGVARVVGVDPSPVMLTLLRRQARRQGLGNVTTMTGRWQDVEIEPFDVGLCSYVLPLIEDARTFLAKLDAACRDHAFVYLSAMSTDAVFDPFWRHFHGAARNPGPTYLDAVAVLAELGIRADVEVVELPLRTRFTTVAAAARDYRENLLLPDIPEVRKELRALLSTWLVTSDGSLRPPLQTTPAAILHWQPSRRRGRP